MPLHCCFFLPPSADIWGCCRYKGKRTLNILKKTFCLQKNLTLFSPNNNPTTVRAPSSRPELRSQTPRTSVSQFSDDLLCVFFFSLSPQSACHYAALEHYKGQLDAALANCTNTKYIIYSLDALDKCTGPPAVSLGDVTFCSWPPALHVAPTHRQKCLTRPSLPPQAGCKFTLSVHHTFGSFTSALKTFVSNFNSHVWTAEWIQMPSRPYFNFILT